MSQTKDGAKKTKKALYERYGRDYYRNIGRKGGLVKSKSKGFGGMPKHKVMAAGAKGGTISRKRKV